jgi:hypothetical protein
MTSDAWSLATATAMTPVKRLTPLPVVAGLRFRSNFETSEDREPWESDTRVRMHVVPRHAKSLESRRMILMLSLRDTHLTRKISDPG